MRRNSGSMKAEAISDDQGIFLGFDLGADYCSEHEWGIKDLRRDLGMRDDINGAARYAAHNHNNIFHWISSDKTKGLLVFSKGLGVYSSFPIPENYKEAINMFSEIQAYEQYDPSTPRVRGQKQKKADKKYEEVVGGWSDRDFGVHTTTPQGTAYLIELWEAIQRDDFGLMVSGKTNPFANGGLVVFIVSRLPKEIDKSIKEAHEDAIRLSKAADKTKIVKQIDDLNKRTQTPGSFMRNGSCAYIALSPRWAENWNAREPQRQTKYDVIFWLNPMNQKERFWGYVTVEELQQWMKGKGWIMQKDHPKKD